MSTETKTIVSELPGEVEVTVTSTTVQNSAPKSSNLINSLGKSAFVSKKYAYSLAFNQALEETQLTKAEIRELWNEYNYMIDRRTGRPFDHIPVKLPREYVTYTKTVVKGKTVTERDTYTDSDVFSVPIDEAGTDYCQFSRSKFYSNPKFQTAVKNYYYEMGREAEMFSTYRGWVMKIY